MATELSIMNAALSHLGEERQLDDPDPDVPSREQRVLQALLPDVRDTILRKHPWLCAETRPTVTRQPLDGPADHTFTNVFLLPTELLRLWSAGTDCSFQVGPLTVYDGAGVATSRRRALFTDAAGPLNLRIVERIAYEHLDPCLADAMGFELASRAAGPLQADKALRKSLKEEAREALALAVTVETSEFADDVVVIPRGRFLSSR